MPTAAGAIDAAMQNLHVANQAAVIEKGRSLWSGSTAQVRADEAAHARYLAV